MAKLMSTLIQGMLVFAQTVTEVTVTVTATMTVTVVDCCLTTVTIIVSFTVTTVTAQGEKGISYVNILTSLVILSNLPLLWSSW